MTSDEPSLAGLRYRAGATQNTLDAWELQNGCSPRDPKLIAEHNALLLENIESKNALEIEEAILTGRMNFRPEPKKRKTTKRN